MDALMMDSKSYASFACYFDIISCNICRNDNNIANIINKYNGKPIT